MLATTRFLILFVLIGLCYLPVGCGDNSPDSKSSNDLAGGYPTREQCSQVKAGMTLQEAVSALGQYPFSFSREGVVRQVGWCYGTCDPDKGDGVFIAHVESGKITKTEFAAEANFVEKGS